MQPSNMFLKNLFVFCSYLVLSVTVYAHPFRGRIIGGQLAEPGQFPYLVSIQEDIPGTGTTYHDCGGSILNSQWVVTAAHCVMPPYVTIQIIAGTNDLGVGGIRYNLSNIITHSGYDYNLNINDIALIKVDGEFYFTDTITSIEIGEVTGNESCVTAGWGQTETEMYPKQLRFLEVTCLSPDDCLKLAEGSPWGDQYPPGPGNVCTISPKGQGPCHGDSGSALVYNNRLVGMTVYELGNDCGLNSSYPEVYTRTSYFKDWVESTIAAN